jgi:hypothetical protein
MLIVVEKKRGVERTAKLIRASPSSEVAVYGVPNMPSPLKVQISQEGDY